MSVAVKADGDTAFVVYIPGGVAKTRTVKLHGMPAGASYGGQWVNPRTGQKTDLGPPLDVSDGQIVLPDRPGGDDWLAILRKRDQRGQAE
jgi:hypothetical protein